MAHRISINELKALFRRYDNGEFLKDIALELGMKPNTLSCMFKRHHLKKTIKGKYSCLPYEEIYRMHVEDGIQYKVLGEIYNIPYKSLRYNLRLRGFASDKDNFIPVPLEDLFERYLDGEMQKELAEEYGISSKALSNRLSKVGHKKHILINDYTFEEIDALCKKLGSLKAVSNKLGLVYGSLLRWYSNRGLSAKGYKIVNHHFFELMDTQAAAYFLGFIYADGYVYARHNFVRIKIKVIDVHILEKLAKLLLKGHKEIPTWEEDGRRVCSLCISSEKLIVDLKDWGVFQAKTFKIKFPNNLPKDMIPHFIRGYFDGDGCIYVPKILGKGHTPKVTIVSACRCMLTDLQTVLLRVGIQSNLYPVNPNESKINWHVLYIGRKAELKKFYDYIYDNVDPELYLLRKYHKFQGIKGINGE